MLSQNEPRGQISDSRQTTPMMQFRVDLLEGKYTLSQDTLAEALRSQWSCRFDFRRPSIVVNHYKEEEEHYVVRVGGVALYPGREPLVIEVLTEQQESIDVALQAIWHSAHTEDLSRTVELDDISESFFSEGKNEADSQQHKSLVLRARLGNHFHEVTILHLTGSAASSSYDPKLPNEFCYLIGKGTYTAPEGEMRRISLSDDFLTRGYRTLSAESAATSAACLPQGEVVSSSTLLSNGVVNFTDSSANFYCGYAGPTADVWVVPGASEALVTLLGEANNCFVVIAPQKLESSHIENEARFWGVQCIKDRGGVFTFQRTYEGKSISEALGNLPWRESLPPSFSLRDFVVADFAIGIAALQPHLHPGYFFKVDAVSKSFESRDKRVARAAV